MDSLKTGQGRRLLINQELFCSLQLFLKALLNLIARKTMNRAVMINTVKIIEGPRMPGGVAEEYLELRRTNNSKSEMRGFFASLRMTSVEGDR